MSYIACTCDCVYQCDGICNLDRAASSGAPEHGEKACVHYIKRTAKRQSQQKQQP